MTRPRPLRPSAPDFRVLFESAPGLYLVLGPDLGILAASDAYLRATMTERDAILGRHLFDVFPDNPADSAATGESNLRSSLERVLAQRRPDTMAVQKYDIRRPESAGGGFEERFWSPVNSPVLGTDGAVKFIIHRVEDVTEFMRLERKGIEQDRRAEELQTRAGTMEAEIVRRAQELQEANCRLRELQSGLEERVRQRTLELEQSEARYRLLFQASPHPMWVHDRGTRRFLAVNDAAIRLFGYTAEEFLGMTVGDLGPVDHPGETQHRHRDGSELSLEVAAHDIRFDGRAAVLAQATDITRRTELESQLRQSQKLEAIGLLAGGVAHDFNNLLTAIMGHAELLQMRLSSEPGVQAEARAILDASQRAAGLTRQLLAFSRRQVLEPRVLDLNAILSELDRLLRRMIGTDVDYLTVTGDDLGRVRVDPGQIGQVLLNLAVNARDAMPGGGKLTVETVNVDLDEGYVRGRVDMPPGRYVLLAVSDTGCGMSPDVVARIFEPFFTTKPTGQGTGLGLSTVHGIVRQSGGHIEVYSEVGSGTTFKIFLPRVEDAPEPLPRTPAAGGVRGDETVMLVEDEEGIRRVVVRALELHGYRVLPFASAEEALPACEGAESVVDLLITDVVMPGMSGPELARRASLARPGLPILLISGYADRALIHQGQREAESSFLQKPFTPEMLVRRVRAILDARRRPVA